MAISMLKIRRPLGRLIFNMGIAIPGKTVFLIETAPSNFYIFFPFISCLWPVDFFRGLATFLPQFEYCLHPCSQFVYANVFAPMIYLAKIFHEPEQ